MSLPGSLGASVASAVQSRRQGPAGTSDAASRPSSASSRASAAANGASAQSLADAAVSSLEAALEAWAACQPEGYTLPASAVQEALPVIRNHVPDSWVAPQTGDLLKELFESPEPVFKQLLKVRGEQVHFLDFWRGFSKAARLLTSLLCEGIAQDEGLAMELETVRDSVLRLLEVSETAEEHSASNTVQMSALVEAVRKAASMSRSPDFWREVEARLQARPEHTEFTLEELGEVMLAWLQEAIVWQQEYVIVEPSSSSGASSKADSSAKKQGVPVFLHIYDVSQEDGVRKLNKFLAHRYSPLKFGGVFHAGVEVNGLEWSYGMSPSSTLPGLTCVLPKTHPCHRYRQTVDMRRSPLSAEEIADLISHLAEEYPGNDYHILRRNCCHFADDFCRRIGVGGIPGWVHRLARVGANVDTVMQKVMNRKLLDEDESDDD
mmetsp:Transcript_27287/g.78567  ORF Transcript_27287/g.78567 Transcript_27287/m.78567 type:complete len:435 (-) Transcript_27287:13-1317(-)